MAKSSINFTDLDFITLKNNFKNYLRNQPQFKDYDFEGSNMAVLLDLLAYNTSKQAFFTNMLFSEGHLDSAQLRSSIVSHAKDLNYTPRSAKSAKATVRVDFEASGDNQPYVIAKGSAFSSIVKATNFIFTTNETLTVSSANGTFSFETDIYEGTFVEDTYVFRQTEDIIPRFRLNNQNIDTDSLTVTVYEDNSSNGQLYNLANTLLDLDYTSQVFFIQSNFNEYYEVYFGDDILGKKPKEFSTVVMNYRVTEGPSANGASVFTMNFDPTGAISELEGTATVTTTATARGGANSESKESIRYYAPRAYQIQERTITEQDYEIALKTQFPEINAIHAFGGEELNPPQFGRVYIAVDIQDVDGFPESKKRQYGNFLAKRAPFSIEPIFTEPEYSYLSLNALIRYNVNVTKVSENTIRTLITTTVTDYNQRELNDFAVTYRNSKLACDIDETDISIISSNLEAQIYKKVDVPLNESTNIVLKYDMELQNDIPPRTNTHKSNLQHAFTSSPFKYLNETCVVEDNGDGKIQLIKKSGDQDTLIYNLGSINYDTGEVIINNLIVNFYIGNSMKFYVRPRDPDITVKNNTILTIENDEINVTVETLRE